MLDFYLRPGRSLSHPIFNGSLSCFFHGSFMIKSNQISS